MSADRCDMVMFRKVEQFAARSRLVKSEEKLKRIVEEICEDIGFRYYSLVHHVDFDLKSKGAIVMHNYPESWAECFTERRLFTRDPVHRACRTTNLGFSWAHVPSMIRFTSDDADVLRTARLFGIGDGFTVPAHVPGEPNGSCSFATTPDRILREEQLHVARIVGAFAFEAARRLARMRAPSTGDLRPLTSRQRECLALVAKGKTDWEISRILGVTHDTVTQHLKAAKARYGVTKRVPLAVRALYDGSISFAEVLERHTHFQE